MKTKESSLILSSVKIYRTLLWLYPTEHREEYGWLMVQLFHDRAWDTYQRDGDAGIVLYWLNTLLDLFISVIQERMEKGFTMSFNFLAKLRSPLMMMGGGLVTLSSYSPLEPGYWWNGGKGLYGVADNLLLPGLILFGAGLIGMFITMKPRITGYSRIWTVVGICITVLLGGMSLIAGIMSAPDWDWSSLGWGIFVILMTGITFSLILLAKLLFDNGQRWSILLAIHPTIYLGLWITSFFSSYEDTRGPHWDEFIIIASMGLIWFIAGYMVRTDMSPIQNRNNSTNFVSGTQEA